MSARTHEKWLEAGQWLEKTRGVPAIVAQEVRKRAAKAMKRAIPAKPKVRLPRGTKTPQKRASLPKLKKELDRVFSLFVRQRGAEPNGLTACVTCGRVAHWKEMDAGHYVPRQDLATRWHERNVWPQCRPDNAFRGGEPEKMAAYIDGRWPGQAAELRELGRRPFKLNRQWLEAKIAHYKGIIHE